MLAGLGFLILVGLLAPPAQFTMTGVKVTSKKAIQRQLLPPAPTVYFNQNFETGIAPFTVVTGPSMSSPFAFWDILNEFQCSNPENDKCAAYYYPGNCQYPGGNTSHLYSPTFVPIPPSGATALQNLVVELDYMKKKDPTGDSTVVYLNNLTVGGSVILEVLPDTATPAFVSRSYSHPGTIGDTWQVEVRDVSNSGGNTNYSSYVDNVRTKGVWTAATGCNSLIIYTPGAETANMSGPSLPVPGDGATFFPSSDHLGHNICFFIDGNQVPPGPPEFPTVPANQICESCPSTCPVMDTSSPTVATMVVPDGEGFTFVIPSTAIPGWIYWMQAYCPVCQKVSRPVPILVY